MDHLGVDQRHGDMSIGDHLSEAPAKLRNGLDKTGVDGCVGHPLVLHRLAHNADAPLDRHPPVRLPVLTILDEPLPVVLLSDPLSLIFPDQMRSQETIHVWMLAPNLR